MDYIDSSASVPSGYSNKWQETGDAPKWQDRGKSWSQPESHFKQPSTVSPGEAAKLNVSVIRLSLWTAVIMYWWNLVSQLMKMKSMKSCIHHGRPARSAKWRVEYRFSRGPKKPSMMMINKMCCLIAKNCCICIICSVHMCVSTCMCSVSHMSSLQYCYSNVH